MGRENFAGLSTVVVIVLCFERARPGSQWGGQELPAQGAYV